MSTRRWMQSLALAAFCGLVVAAPAGAQAQRGAVTGRVSEIGTNQPIPTAQVTVVGTNIGAVTGADGQYTLRGVPAGTAELRVLRVGFVEARASVAVQAGQTATANVQMRSAPIMLTPIVTTATGQQRRTEVGNAIAQVDAAAVTATRPVTNVNELLTARAPGVQVLEGVQTGAGTRVRIRGTSSLSLSNNPIYVIDGIRMEGSTGSSTLSVGGTTPSRVGDINPDEIESIEVVKGPSAATLYGTDAANGVIVITTKKGLAGRAQWTYYTEQTAITDRNSYPTAYRGWRSGSTAANTTQCFLTATVVTGSTRCAQDSVTSYNLHDDPEATPYGTGYRQQHGLQLRGGTDAIRYFVSGEYESEDGVTQVPKFERRYLNARGITLSSIQENPNGLTRMSGRANLSLTLPGNADLAFNTGYTSLDQWLPMSDDSGVSGIAANTYGGPGFKYNLTSTGDTLYGWRQFTPRDIYQAESKQSVERIISSVNGNWRPSEWLALRGNFGVDYAHRLDMQLCRYLNCPDVGTDRQGFKRDNRTNFFSYTSDVSATGTARFTEAMQSRTTVGAQYGRNIFDRNGATGLMLAGGSTTISGAGVLQADESASETRIFGAFVEEQLAIRDRLFLTAAVRSDRNSAAGANFKTAYYPKLSGSWVISQEDFWPRAAWLSQLRLRTAYGASGVQPGTTDAIAYYTPLTARGESGEAPVAVFSALGNKDLKPERSTELEAGFDAAFLDERVSLELTYYNKHSRDALIERTLPPSVGTGVTSRFENLGGVRNWGWEWLLTANPIRRTNWGWDVSVNGSKNSNELETLTGAPNITLSSTQQHRVGYPLFGWWSRPLKSFSDANGNGIIEVSEIVVGDTAEFLGYSQPRTELAFTNGIDFWRRHLRLTAMFDYRAGHMVYNNTERIRCASRNNCAGLIDPNSSLYEQARTVAVREHPSRTVGGFIEKGDFLRFRELALTFNAPETWAGRLFRGRSLSATASVRNIHVWTDYMGVDPEATGSATGNAPSEFQAFGPPTFIALRLNLGF